MDASEKNPSSSMSSRNSAVSRVKDADENDQEMGFSFQNPKKSTAKNFMSPTISAASKAALPNKKILAERNQSPASNPSGAQPPKTPISDSKVRQSIQTLEQSLQGKTPNSYSKATSKNQEADCSKEESFPQTTPLTTPADKSATKEVLSVRPYDPLTNYLSPRPQFLRYNPNRRIEIFQRLKLEAEEEDDRVSVSSGGIGSKKESDEEDGTINSNSSVVSSSEFHLEHENEECDETEDDSEVKDEEGWSLRGILQFLLVLAVLVLSTSYISSMNSPSGSPDLHAFKSLRERYDQFQTHVYDILLSLDSGYHFFDEGAQMGLLGLNHTVQDEAIDEDKEITENGNLGERVSMNVITTVFGLDDGNMGHVETAEDVKQKRKSEDVCEVVLMEKSEVYDEIVDVIELLGKDAGGKNEYLEIVEEIKQRSKSEDWEVSLVETGGVSNQMVKNIELLGNETVEKNEGLEMVEHVKDNIVSEETESVANNEPIRVDQTPLFLEGVDQQCDKMVMAEADEEIHINETREEDIVERDVGRMDDVKSMASEVAIPEPVNVDQTPLFLDGVAQQCDKMVMVEADEEIHFNETTEEDIVERKIGRMDDVKSMESEVAIPEKKNPVEGVIQLLPEVAVGLSICFVVVASLVSVIHIKRKKRKVTNPSPVDLPSAEPGIAKKSSLVHPHEREDHSMPWNSLANSTPLVNSNKEGPEESYQSRAPTVELLGEFVVGEISGSRRRSDIKSRVKDSEVGSYPVSALRNRLASKTSSEPVHAKDDFQELSATISSSYGNFTSETKKLRKQFRNNDMEGEDGGEGREAVATPLRRSARIRSRAVSYS